MSWNIIYENEYALALDMFIYCQHHSPLDLIKHEMRHFMNGNLEETPSYCKVLVLLFMLPLIATYGLSHTEFLATIQVQCCMHMQFLLQVWFTSESSYDFLFGLFRLWAMTCYSLVIRPTHMKLLLCLSVFFRISLVSLNKSHQR